MLAIVVVYFLLAFFLYAVSDFVTWRSALYRSHIELQRERALRTEADAELLNNIVYRFRSSSQRWSILAGPVSATRALFEFAVPVLFGIYAIFALLTTPPPKALPPPKNAENFLSQTVR